MSNAGASISEGFAAHKAASDPKIIKVVRALVHLEKEVSDLWDLHVQQSGALRTTVFQLGGKLSDMKQIVDDEGYPGGFSAYLEDRKIPVPRGTAIRYINCYQAAQDVPAPLLEAAGFAGIDVALPRNVAKIKQNRNRIPSMTGTQFVGLLNEQSTRRAAAELTPAQWVVKGMDALNSAFSPIKDEAQKNAAFLGVAKWILSLAPAGVATNSDNAERLDRDA
jgi:hypothetical protein